MEKGTMGRCGLEADPHKLDQDKCVGWAPVAVRGTGGHCTMCGALWDDCHANMERLADALETLTADCLLDEQDPAYLAAKAALRLAGRLP